jgi:hypothetical protein
MADFGKPEIIVLIIILLDGKLYIKTSIYAFIYDNRLVI